MSPDSSRHLALALLFLYSLSVHGEVQRCLPDASPPLVHEGATLRVASLNIAHGRGDSLNQMLIGRARIEENIDRVAMALADSGAQLVALQELDVGSLWAGGVDQALSLQEGSNLPCAYLGLHAQTWLYRFGTALLSSVQLSEARVTTFEPTPPTTTKGMVAAKLKWRLGETSRAVRVVLSLLDFSRKSARRRQLQAIIDAINASPVPIILLGDFNEQWGSKDSAVRALVEDAGMITWESASNNFPTYENKRLRSKQFVTGSDLYRNRREELSRALAELKRVDSLQPHFAAMDEFFATGWHEADVRLAHEFANLTNRTVITEAVANLSNNPNSIMSLLEQARDNDRSHSRVVSPYLFLARYYDGDGNLLLDEAQRVLEWLDEAPNHRYEMITNSVLTSDNFPAQSIVDMDMAPRMLLTAEQKALWQENS
jgi:endonuclease/exonuclease/phosphatase family metal-dependent hydrolase